MKKRRLLSNELKIAALGIICISFLAAYALYKGVDGTMFGTAMAGIGGVVGWVFKGYSIK